jgi:hypothetical protein
MSTPVSAFIQKKKDESPFVSLQDGESVVVKKLREIKVVSKSGFGGEEKEVLRLKCDIETATGETRIKDFDNGTARFAQELQDKNVEVGDGFTLTRTGQLTKTRYTVSNVVKPAGAAAPAAPAPAVAK